MASMSIGIEKMLLSINEELNEHKLSDSFEGHVLPMVEL